MLLTAVLLPGMCFTVMFCLNFIAVGYNTSNVIPFTVMISLVCLALPQLSFGGSMLIVLPACHTARVLGPGVLPTGGRWHDPWACVERPKEGAMPCEQPAQAHLKAHLNS